jgi:hypothetical protein
MLPPLPGENTTHYAKDHNLTLAMLATMLLYRLPAPSAELVQQSCYQTTSRKSQHSTLLSTGRDRAHADPRKRLLLNHKYKSAIRTFTCSKLTELTLLLRFTWLQKGPSEPTTFT